GVGSSFPSRTMRSRPARSVTRILPSGRNARLHGCDSPVTTGTTRIGSSAEKNVCGSDGGDGDDRAPCAQAKDVVATTIVRANARTPRWDLALNASQLGVGSCTSLMATAT